MSAHPHTSAAHVVLEKCAAYADGLHDCVNGLLAPLGGIGAFVRPGQRVLVKPNLLTDAPPEAAKTTHPEVVRAVLRVLKDAGAHPFVADSPASVMKIERVWETTGFRALCEAEQVPLLRLEQGGAVSFKEGGFTFSIARQALDADVIVGVPKIKTHVLTGLTCAVKNMYGCIPGLQKSDLHKRYFNATRFGRLIASVYTRVRPNLVIADGIVGMHGNGPTGGEPYPLGLLAAANDGAALDVVLCAVLGLNPRTVPYLAPLRRNGAGETRLDAIQLSGADTAHLRPRGFRAPNTAAARLVPSWLVRILRPWLWSRPVFDERCVSCGLCVRMCPAAALEIRAPGSRPVLDAARCVECCCCHEVCPERAVDMQLSPLFSRLQQRDQCLRMQAKR